MNREHRPRRWQIAVFPAIGFLIGCLILSGVAILLSHAAVTLSRPAQFGLALAAFLLTGILAGSGFYIAVRLHPPDRAPLSDQQMSDVIEMMARAAPAPDRFDQN